MAFKIKKITTRFVLQDIYLILGGLLIVFIMFVSSNRKNDVTKAFTLSEKILSGIQQFDNYFSLAQNRQKTDIDFVSVTSDRLITEQTRQVQQLNDTLFFLKNIRFLKKSLVKNRLADTLQNVLNKYNRTFELALLSIKYKGNQNEGLVADAYKIAQQLYNELKNAPDKGFQASQLENISNNYFKSLETNYLLSLKDFCNNISFSFIDYPSYDLSTINTLSIQLINTLNNLEQTDLNLLNSAENKGLLADVKELSVLAKKYIALLQTHIHMQSKVFNRRWNLVLLAIIFIYVLIYSSFMFRFNHLLVKNLFTIHSNSSDLRKGYFEIAADTGCSYEFKDINSNLSELKLSLNERKNFLEKLLNDDFSKKIELLGDNDEFTKKLIELREKLFKAQEEQIKRDRDNDIRRYINEGLAKFGDIMRVNSSNTQALGDNLIKELVKYLGALQGGLFLADENDTNILHLIAAFAYDRKKYLKKTIKNGEGLVGTCAIERKTISLNEIPKDYILIKSGLGDTPPNNLLLVPVIHEENLIGVIELASLKMLDKHEIELTELIASNLAATIITVRNNTRTAQLLEKSQQQAADMAEQEEEMRQNMEELKATQEESARREEEMAGIIDSIGNIFYIIEYSSDGSVFHLNEKLVNFLGEPYESLIGKKHHEIFSASSLITPSLISDLTNTKESKKISETLSWGSKQLSYTHNLSPVLSKYGEVIKILNLLTIEEAKLA